MFENVINESVKKFLRDNILWITIISTGIVLVLTDLHPLLVFAIALVVYFVVSNMVTQPA